ncbi:MAG: calcium/sodium antiporter [Clostridiales bacterium]|nr:calcium/sodium antiporter [Clostridiales bacterium]
MFDFFNVNSNIFLLIAVVVVAFLLIIYGGNFFVDSAIWMAKVTHIPQIIIGATIVSIGTTLPEIFTSYMAAGIGQTTMAVGNATGSILCNFALVFGLTLIAFTVLVNKKEFLQKFIILLVSVILLIVFSLDKKIALFEGLILTAIFVVFMTLNIISAVKEMKANKGLIEEDTSYKDKKAWVMILLFVVGAVGIAFGANLMIDSVSAIAEKAGISEQVISLTVVALGTSLPELITTITSIIKKNSDISLGNILGANILNATLITGGSVLIANGIDVPPTDMVSLMVSFGIIFALIAVLSIPIILKSRTFKWQGIVFESLYVCYLAFLILQLVGVIPYAF